MSNKKNNKQAPQADEALFAFFNEVGIISQLSSTALQRALPDGLTLAQVSVLNHLVRLGGNKTPARLAASFQVTKGAMTNTLKRLEARKAITITPDPKDGRSKLVSLTDKGRELRDKAFATSAPQYAAVAAAFSKEEFKAALPFLQAVREFLDNARNDTDFPDD